MSPSVPAAPALLMITTVCPSALAISFCSARHDVGIAARGKRHDYVDRSSGIGLRQRTRRHERGTQRAGANRACDKADEPAAHHGEVQAITRGMMERARPCGGPKGGA